MRVLLDEHLPRLLADDLVGHEVLTVHQQGWKGLTNGELLRRAAEEGFQIFLSADGNLEFQQKLSLWPLGFVILRARSNDLDDLLPLVPEVLEAIDSVQAGQVIHVAV